MIRLNAVDRTLEVLLAGAVTTNELAITVGYSDATGQTYNGATQLSRTNGVTAVTACGAPASQAARDIDYVVICNDDTVAATVTVRVAAAGILYDQVKASVPAGRQLIYTHAAGWNVGDINATPTGADPTALVGLTAVNGTALTFMRSDGAPGLNQAITPTWTGVHTFSQTILADIAGNAATATTSGSTSGNAATATALQTARTINGVSFNGTANITIPVPAAASPSASVGLAAVNGAASTFMRSDAAPALDQAIAPTWTGAHIYSSTIQMGAVSVPASTKLWLSADASTAAGVATYSSASATVSASLQVQRWRGSVASPSAVLSGDRLGTFLFAGASSTTASINSAAILATAMENFSSTNAGSQFEFATTTIGAAARTTKAVLTDAGAWQTLSKLYPGTDASAFQTVCGLYAGTGAPNNANGANGDIYFNAAGGALTTIYQKRAGAWVGIA